MLSGVVVGKRCEIRLAVLKAFLRPAFHDFSNEQQLECARFQRVLNAERLERNGAFNESPQACDGCRKCLFLFSLSPILPSLGQVVALSQYRLQLSEYLRSRMQAIAPNLTIMVGELVGARLIAHAGSLINLAKQPASTVQILGAEKALFRALKTKVMLDFRLFFCV